MSNVAFGQAASHPTSDQNQVSPRIIGDDQFLFSLADEQYFHQDVARGKDASSLGTVYNFPESFGLKSGDWKGFDSLLDAKNSGSPDQVYYAVIFLARHGQGYHNVGEEYVGSTAWKEPSQLSPETPIHEYFPDAHLTPVGQHQADTLSTRFGQFLDNESNKLPWPQAFYVSPLHRALETSYRTWAPLSTNYVQKHSQSEESKRLYQPIVLEALREQIFVQYCNKRSTEVEMEDFEFSYIKSTSNLNLSYHMRGESTLAGGSIDHDETTSSSTRKFSDIFSYHPQDDTRYQNAYSSPSLPPISPIQQTQSNKSTKPDEQDTIYQHFAQALQRDESNPETTDRAYKALCSIFNDIFSETMRPTLTSTTNSQTNTSNEVTNSITDSNGSGDNHNIATSKKPKKKYISITTHAGLMSGIYRVLGIDETQVPRFPTGIVIPLVIRVERSHLTNNSHPNLNPDLNLIPNQNPDLNIDTNTGSESESKLRSGVRRVRPRSTSNFKPESPTYTHTQSHGQNQEELSLNKPLVEILQEIQDRNTYNTLIRKVEMWRDWKRKFIINNNNNNDTSADHQDLEKFDDVGFSLIERTILRALI